MKEFLNPIIYLSFDFHFLLTGVKNTSSLRVKNSLHYRMVRV